MSTPATHYTKLYPKQGNLTGSPGEPYNLLAAKYFDHILGGIGAGTIAALGTVALGSYNLFYIYAPQVHTDLSGNFQGFVGNASNKIGEFSCIHIHKDSFGLFHIINSKANLEEAMPGHSSTLIPFAPELLTNTVWANPSDDISGAFFLNFFIIYFGQDFPQGAIFVRYSQSNYVGIWREMHIEAHASGNSCISRCMRLETHASPDALLVSLHSTPLSTPLCMESLCRYITTTHSWHMAQNREMGGKGHLPPHC